MICSMLFNWFLLVLIDFGGTTFSVQWSLRYSISQTFTVGRLGGWVVAEDMLWVGYYSENNATLLAHLAS